MSEILKIIEANGWCLADVRGSHRQYRYPTKPGRITVPGKPGRVLPMGTEGGILKQAGLDWESA